MFLEPERVFFGAKHTVSDQRNSLGAETIEPLECMKSWFKLEIFTEQDLTAIIETEEGVAEALEV